jgi:hypothetical protein
VASSRCLNGGQIADGQGLAHPSLDVNERYTVTARRGR